MRRRCVRFSAVRRMSLRCALSGAGQGRVVSSKKLDVPTRWPRAGYFVSAYLEAQVAQSVEQRTENSRVGGSIPPLGTI